MAAPLPVCVAPPPGVCVTVCPPGCVCPAVLIDCAPKPVPVNGEIMIVLITLAVVIVAHAWLRRKA